MLADKEVAMIEGGRLNLDEKFVVTWLRLRHEMELQRIVYLSWLSFSIPDS